LIGTGISFRSLYSTEKQRLGVLVLVALLIYTRQFPHDQGFFGLVGTRSSLDRFQSTLEERLRIGETIRGAVDFTQEVALNSQRRVIGLEDRLVDFHTVLEERLGGWVTPALYI